VNDKTARESDNLAAAAKQRDAEAVDEHFSDVPDEEPLQDQVRSAEEPSAEEQLAQLQTELEDAKKRTLLSQAELENFRKRTRRDMEQERQYALLPLLRDLLPAIDNLELALAIDSSKSDASGVIEGVRMVAQQLNGVLKENHCETIEAQGLAFDPEVHEAVEQRETDEHEAGMVIEVRQTGYQLRDRVIRPARVVVARASGNRPTDAESAGDAVENEV
jgi:molecular chaperone GrpE